MTPDQERLLLRQLAIEACERTGNGLGTGSPTAVRVQADMNADAATSDVCIIAYAANLADEESYEPLDENVDPDDAWLNGFTYDLARPCLTTAGADQYRRLRDELDHLLSEIKEVEREHSLMVEVLRTGIDDRLDPRRLLDSECLASPTILAQLGVETPEDAQHLLAGEPELDEATAKLEKRKAARRIRTLSQELEKLRQTNLPRIREINEQLHRLGIAGTEGVISPALSARGLAVWAMIRRNKALVENQLLHRRAQEEFQDRIKNPPRVVASHASTRLTPAQRRLFDVMSQYDSRATFDELREAWDEEVQEEAIIKALKRLRKKLPRSQWDFEISKANWEIIWHKKGQAVP